MKRKLLNLVAFLLSILIILPVFAVNPVQAATTPSFAAENLRNYILKNGKTTANGNKGLFHTTYEGSHKSTAEIVAFTSGGLNDLIEFYWSVDVHGADGTDFTLIYCFEYSIKANDILDHELMAQTDVFGMSAISYCNKFYKNYTPTTSLSFATRVAFPDHLSNTAAVMYQEALPMAMRDFESVLNLNGFTLGLLGFTYIGYNNPSFMPNSVSARWYETTTATSKTYSNTKKILVEADSTNVTSYKVFYCDELISSGNGSSVQVLIDKCNLRPIGGYFPAGKYTVIFYKNNTQVLKDSCIVQNKTPNAPLPPFNPSVPGSGIEGFVTRLYQVLLNRNPDSAGKADWVNKLKSKSKTGGDVARGFLTSNEFYNKNYSDSSFVTLLYRTFFNREPDSTGLKYWLLEIANGKSRNTVITGFINSNEWATICAQYGIASGGTGKVVPSAATKDFATRLYTKCLGRTGSSSEIDYWALKLTIKETTGKQAAQNFFFGKEFIAKKYSDEEFVKRLYRTCLNREPSSSDVSYWVKKIKSGSSRQTIFNSFASSSEFITLCRKAGINP